MSIVEKAISYRDSKFNLYDYIKVSCYDMLFDANDFIRQKKVELRENGRDLKQVLISLTKEDGNLYYQVIERKK